MREHLLKMFGLILKASSRKKVYAQKARIEGRADVSRLLRAIAESESIQARRILYAFRGQIDLSENYIVTIFSKETTEIIDEYSSCLGQSQHEGNKSTSAALAQLRAAERRILSLNPQQLESKGQKIAHKFLICQFCGYIATEKVPEICPICGADCNGFRDAE